MSTSHDIEHEIDDIAEALSVEEIANSITHGFGLALSVVGFCVLLVMSVLNGDAVYIAACAIYGLSLIVLYAASTFYHSCRSAKLKDRLQVTDHCGIYLLIAGSYTPFVLVTLGGSSLGWTLFVAIWTMAVTFIVLKLIFRARFMALWVVSYLLMGWLGVVAMRPLLELTGWGLLGLILAGGAAYTLGVVFYASPGIRHHHAIWHVFVMIGSICHYLAVAIYVRPN